MLDRGNCPDARDAGSLELLAGTDVASDMPGDIASSATAPSHDPFA